jgi:hypothetical protein
MIVKENSFPSVYHLVLNDGMQHIDFHRRLLDAVEFDSARIVSRHRRIVQTLMGSQSLSVFGQ